MVFGKPRYEPIVSLSERSLQRSEFEKMCIRDRLASGTQTLVSGAQTLASGTGSLVSGTQTLMDGADTVSYTHLVVFLTEHSELFIFLFEG